MKDIILSNDEALFFLNPDLIIEVGEVNGETRIAYVNIITVKQSVAEIRKQLTKKQAEKIRWGGEPKQ